mgnify:CR=1 FL=1
MKMAQIFGRSFLDELRQGIISVVAECLKEALPQQGALISKQEVASRLGVTKHKLDCMTRLYSIPFHVMPGSADRSYIYSDVLAAIRAGSSYDKLKRRTGRKPKKWLTDIVESQHEG